MRHALPPDRDPLLRAALGHDKADQISELWSMFGEPKPAAVTGNDDAEPAAFVHCGAEISSSPAGGLSYRPAPLEPPIAEGDARRIAVAVEHDGLKRRSTLRAPKTMARLQKTIDQHLPLRGIHTFPVAGPPMEWTSDHLAWLGRMMAQCLPPDPGAGQVVKVRVCTWGGVIELEVRRDRGWCARCRLSPAGLLETVREWARGERDPTWFCRIVGPEPITAGPEPAARIRQVDAQGWDDDDDLDAFEKAARRRLHGDINIPATSAPAPTSVPFTLEEISLSKQKTVPVWLAAIDWTAQQNIDPTEIGRQLMPLFICLIEMVRVNPREAKDSVLGVAKYIELLTNCLADRKEGR